MPDSKKQNLTDSQIEEVLEQMSDAFKKLPRAPILHRPSEVGLFYEEVTFSSIDGVPLEGWFIPSEGSDKIIIVNHPMGFTRSGLPSHLEPWKSIWQASGNDMEVNFIPDLKIFHEAGFNILAYDLRNHGHSGTGNGGLISTGIFESRDILGSIRYIRERHDTKSMKMALFSRCLGADATFYAMKHNPKDFEPIRCLVGVQPLSEEYILKKQLELAHIPKNRIKDLDHKITMKTGFSIEDRNAGKWAKHVCVPTFIYQVHDDLLTDPSDVQGMYDDIPLKDKKLQWIYDTTARWDGYLEFQRRPEPMLKWFDQHM